MGPPGVFGSGVGVGDMTCHPTHGTPQGAPHQHDVVNLNPVHEETSVVTQPLGAFSSGHSPGECAVGSVTSNLSLGTFPPDHSSGECAEGSVSIKSDASFGSLPTDKRTDFCAVVPVSSYVKGTPGVFGSGVGVGDRTCHPTHVTPQGAPHHHEGVTQNADDDDTSVTHPLGAFSSGHSHCECAVGSVLSNASLGPFSPDQSWRLRGGFCFD